MAYVYYRIYQILKKVKSNDTPAFNSLIFLIILQALNIISLLAVGNFFKFINMTKSQAIFYAISLFLLLLIANFLLVFRRFNKIIKKYENESKSKRRKGTLLVISYVLFSVILFIIGGNLK